VARLTKDFTQVKGKMEQNQLHQDNPSREWRSFMKDKRSLLRVPQGRPQVLWVQGEEWGRS
jgi:hypothetical protein